MHLLYLFSVNNIFQKLIVTNTIDGNENQINLVL